MTDDASRIGVTLRGKYRLEEVLGSGGMAEVYRARNVLAGRHVAIKMLHPEMLAHKEVVRRFLREARAANTVRHPNIVDVLDVDEDDNGVPFIVQEYLEGIDLEAKIESLDLTPTEVLELFIPVTEAVGLAHESGIVHRDLKPDNVFLAKVRGEVIPKVLDFGISKLPVDDGNESLSKSWGTSNDVRITRAGSAMGTPLYMSPEQIRDPRGVDARTDVWSLGVMLYKALSGTEPFDGDNIAHLFANINTTRPAPLESIAPDVPLHIVKIVDKCLSPEPNGRYAHGQELAEALKKARAQITDEAPPRPLSLDPPSSGPVDLAPPSEPGGFGALGEFHETELVSQDVESGLLDGTSTPELERFPTPSGLSPDLTPTGPTDRSFTRSLTGVHREIEHRVEAALSRKGLGGRVVVRGELIELRTGSGSLVTTDLGKLVEQWRLLPPEMCDRRVDMIVKRLSGAAPERSSAGGGGSALPKVLVGAILLVALVGGGLWAQRKGVFGGSGADPAPKPTATGEVSPETQALRDQRSCEASRRQLYAGGAVGVDMAGWVVELWLARAQGAGKLTDAVTKAKLSEAAAKALGVASPEAMAVQAQPALGKLDAVLVKFPAAYVRPFFETEGRGKLVTAVQEAVQLTKADHSALFARCAHLETRDVGAWYGGRDRATATLALVYAAGAYADPPAFERTDAAGDAAMLAKLLRAAQGLELSKLEDELKKGGGRLEKAPGGSMAIRFPLGGPTRAAQVSRAVYALLAGGS